MHFGGALCPVSPPEPILPQALCLRDTVPTSQGVSPASGHQVPGPPARGGASPGAAVLGEDTDIPFQPPIPTHLAVPEPAAEERRMYCVRRLLR